jgi:hypothetical protein
MRREVRRTAPFCIAYYWLAIATRSPPTPQIASSPPQAPRARACNMSAKPRPRAPKRVGWGPSKWRAASTTVRPTWNFARKGLLVPKRRPFVVRGVACLPTERNRAFRKSTARKRAPAGALSHWSSSRAQTIARGRAITHARCMPRKRAAKAAPSSVGSRPSEHPTRSEDPYRLASQCVFTRACSQRSSAQR